MESFALRFYCLDVSPKGTSLERFPTLYKKKSLSFGYSCFILLFGNDIEGTGGPNIHSWLSGWIENVKDEVDFFDHKRGSSMCTILTYILRNTSLLFLFIGPILHLA